MNHTGKIHRRGYRLFVASVGILGLTLGYSVGVSYAVVGSRRLASVCVGVGLRLLTGGLLVRAQPGELQAEVASGRKGAPVGVSASVTTLGQKRQFLTETMEKV